jgi:uncharacterized protein (DUF2235 family)
MSKNIVLLSDGTGNTSATLFTTNVWRLYQALDLSNPDRQVAFYLDGVGTSSFKPLATVGIALGYGVKRNVLDFYTFLCRNYQPGDRIFGFGFSRGAFTMRVLIGLVATQGLAPYSGDERQLARDARTAYRRYRENFHTTFGIEKPLRWLRDLWFSHRYHLPRTKVVAPPPERDPRWIHFLGLWDTVDAYGGPLDEITDAIDYWIWPLSMRDYAMSDKVRRACHALALDDERRAFWPRLWREGVVKDRAGKLLRFDEDTDWQAMKEPELCELLGVRELPKNCKPAKIDEERLSQVWFAGMHSDVGGGYSQDGLSFVTLDWMMDRALVYGLRLKDDEKERLRCCANSFDKLNDSRSGFGAYWRYQPRRVDSLHEASFRQPRCVQIWNRLLKWMGFRVGATPLEFTAEQPPAIIHESVFKRMEKGVNAYAPIGLPDTYQITDKAGNVTHGPYPGKPPEKHAGEPAQSAPITRGRGERKAAEPKLPEQERVLNLVWLRRVVYFAAVLVSVLVATFPFINKYYWPKWTEATWTDGVKLLTWVEKVVPQWATFWTAPAKVVPEFVFAGALLITGLLFYSGYVQRSVGNAMHQIWMKRLGQGPGDAPLWPAPRAADYRWIYRLRTKAWYRELFDALRSCIFPTLIALGLPSLLLGSVAYTYIPGLFGKLILAVLLGGWVVWFGINVACIFIAKR